MVSPAIAFLVKGATYLGAASAAAEIGEAVLPRLGVIEPGTKIIKTGAGIVLDVLGVPNNLAGAPPPSASEQSAPPVIGEARTGIPAAPPPASTERRICVMCQGDRPVIAGAGDKVYLDRCETHRTEIEGIVNEVDSLYLGWASAMGVDPNQPIAEGVDVGAAGYCGKKPNKNDDRFRGVFGGLKEDKYFAALDKWQKCVAKEHRDTKAGQKHEKAAVKAQKDRDKAIAKTALDATRRRFEAQIQALKMAQKDAQTDAEKKALQQQIDTLNQSKRDADALNAKIQEQAKDADHQRQIDELKREIATRAQQPGGMDEMFKMVMMQRAMQPSAPPAQQSAPAIMMLQPPAPAGGGGSGVPSSATQILPIMIPGSPDMPVQQQVYVDEGEDFGRDDMDLMGSEDDAIVEEIEIADNLGLAGAVTKGDAMAFQNLRNAWTPEEYAEFTSGFNEISGCGNSIGRCGLPLRED